MALKIKNKKDFKALIFILVVTLLIGITLMFQTYRLIKAEMKYSACNKILIFELEIIEYSVERLNMTYEEFMEGFFRNKVEEIIKEDLK